MDAVSPPSLPPSLHHPHSLPPYADTAMSPQLVEAQPPLDDTDIESLNDLDLADDEDLDHSTASRRNYSSRQRTHTSGSRPGGGLVRQPTSSSIRSASTLPREATMHGDSTSDLAAFLLATGPPGEPPSRSQNSSYTADLPPPSPSSSLSSRRSANFLSRAKNAFVRKGSESTLKGLKGNDAARERRESERAKEALFDEQLRLASLTKKVLPNGTSFYKFEGQQDPVLTGETVEDFYMPPLSKKSSIASKPASTSLGSQSGRRVFSDHDAQQPASAELSPPRPRSSHSRPSTQPKAAPLETHEESGKSYDTVVSSVQAGRNRSATHSGASVGSPFDDHSALRDLPPLPVMPVAIHTAVEQTSASVVSEANAGVPPMMHSRNVSLASPSPSAGTGRRESVPSSLVGKPELEAEMPPAMKAQRSFNTSTSVSETAASSNIDLASGSSSASQSEHRPRSRPGKRVQSADRSTPSSPFRSRAGIPPRLQHMRSPSLLDGGDASARREEEAALQELQRSMGVNSTFRHTPSAVDDALTQFIESRHGSVDQEIGTYDSLPDSLPHVQACSPIGSLAQEDKLRSASKDSATWQPLAADVGHVATSTELNASSDPHELYAALVAARMEAERARELCARALALLRSDPGPPILSAAPTLLPPVEALEPLAGDVFLGTSAPRESMDAVLDSRREPSKTMFSGPMSPQGAPVLLPTATSETSHNVKYVEPTVFTSKRVRATTFASEEEAEELKHGGYALPEGGDSTLVSQERASPEKLLAVKDTGDEEELELAAEETPIAAPLDQRAALLEELEAFLAEPPTDELETTPLPEDKQGPETVLTQHLAAHEGDVMEAASAGDEASANLVDAERAYEQTPSAEVEPEYEDDSDAIPDAVPIHYTPLERLRPDEIPAFPHEAARRLVELEKQTRSSMHLASGSGTSASGPRASRPADAQVLQNVFAAQT